MTWPSGRSAPPGFAKSKSTEHTHPMTGRIECKPYKTGTPDHSEPEVIQELEQRRVRYERMIQGKGAKPFSEVLADRIRRDDPEAQDDQAEDEDEPQRGAKDPYLGLDPNQPQGIAHRVPGTRSGKVIIKG
jgi:hypothetical protein